MDEGEIEKNREGDGNGERNGVGNRERERERERASVAVFPTSNETISLSSKAVCLLLYTQAKRKGLTYSSNVHHIKPLSLYLVYHNDMVVPPPPPPTHTHTMLTFSRHLLTTAKRAQAVHKLSCILQHRPSGRHSPTFSSLDLLPSSLANCIKKTGSLGKPLHTMV